MDTLADILVNHGRLIVICFAVPVIPAVIMILILRNIKEMEPFKNLSTFLNGKFTSNIISASFKGMHEGFPYTIKLYCSTPYDAETGGSSAELTIVFERHTHFTMRVFPEGGAPLANIASLHWYPKIVKTENPEFDNRFTVYSDDVLPVSNYLEKPEVQENIRTLFLSRYMELHISKNMVRAVKYIGDEGLAFYFDKIRLTNTIKSLAFLAKSIS